MSQKVKTRKTYQADEKHALDPLRDFEGGPVELFLARSSRYIRDHIKETILVIAGIALILGSMVGYSVWQAHVKEKSLAAFEKLMENPIMIPGAASSEGAIAKLDSYVDDFSNNDAKNRTDLKKIEYYLKDKDYANAAETSESIAKRVSDKYLKAYFHLKAASYNEMALNYEMAQEQYQSSIELVQESNLMKAVALFGKGRVLIEQGKYDEGRKSIREMMDIKGVEGIEEFKISATAFLLDNQNAGSK